VQTPSTGVYFKHSQNKRRNMAFYAIAQRTHSVADNCTARIWRSAFFNAVETKLRHSGVTGCLT